MSIYPPVEQNTEADAQKIMKTPFDKPNIPDFKEQTPPIETVVQPKEAQGIPISTESELPPFDESLPFESPILSEDSLPPFDESLPVMEDYNPERAFGAPSRADRERLQQAFSGDPMTVIGDGETRISLSNLFSKYDKPETEKKKIALSAYFADMDPTKIKFIYNNIDNHLEQFFKRKISVDEAYQEVGSFLALAKPKERQEPQTGTASEYGSALKSGVSRVIGTIFNAGMSYEKILSYPTVSLLNNSQKNEIFGWKEQIADELSDYQKAEYEKINLPDDWLFNSKNTGEWFVNFGKFLTVETPSQAAQLGLALTAGGTAPFIIGAGIGNDKWYELEREHPEMSYSARLTNASLTGLVNGALEHITVGIIKGKLPINAPGELKAGFKSAFLYYIKSMGIEASEEAAEQLAENTVDIATGVHGSFKDIKPMEFNKLLWNGVPESALAGATFGLPFAATAHPQLRKRAEFRHTVETQLRAEQQTLQSIENPTDAQIQKIREIETLLDAGNLNDLANATQMIALENTDKARIHVEQLLSMERERLKLTESQSPETERTLSRIDEALKNHNPSELLTLAESLDILPKDGTSESLSVEDTDLTDPQIAERNFNLRRALPHNPKDTVDAVTEFSKQFPTVNVTVHDYLSNDLKNMLRERGMTPERVRGWVDGQGDVHVMAENVRPSEVSRVLLHEIVGHKGLKAVFGNRFESFLDGVFASHAAEVEPFAQTYNSDLGTIENKRYLTEEFLASMAENPTKPSWWKEFLQKLKMGLRKLPGLANLRFTDQEIEAALMRSARAMRKKYNTQSKIELRFKLNQDGETLFELGNKTLTVSEIIKDRTLSSSEFILSEDGTPDWGFISKEMVQNAPHELGLEPLPIRLQKGEHWGKHRGFGLVHFFNEHGKEMEKRGIDLSKYIQNVFSKINQVYVSKRQNGNIRLELVNSGKPQNIGILELRSERGFYAVVTAFPRDISNYQLQGKKIWQYSDLPESTGKQQAGSLEPLSTGNVAGTARVDGAKSTDNIQRSVNPFKPNVEKNTLKIQAYESEFGNILNADNAKLLFKDEGYNPADAKSVVQFHPQAGKLVGEIFTQWLQTKKNTGDGTVTFTGGGNGSGKSSASPYYQSSDFVMDSTMINLDAARKSIQAVLDNGQTPRLVFVYRNPKEAWTQGVLKRIHEGGHIVPFTTFANTHTKARENFRLLCEEFGDKVQIKVLESETGNPIREISLEALDSKPLYTKEQLLEEIQNANHGTTAEELGGRQQTGDRWNERNRREVEKGDPIRGTGSTLQGSGRLQPEDGSGERQTEQNTSGTDPDREIIFPERFSLTPERSYDKIKSDLNANPEKYRNANGQLLAPNGEVSKLKEKQWIQVRTPEFKKWFGDWENDPENASKVVDENGEPLVVYHGTGEKFYTFKNEKLGSRENAFFFTSNIKYATDYGKQLIGVFLNSPRMVDLDENFRDANGKSYDVESPEFYENFDGYSTEKETDGNEYAVFSHEQIKSATENTGAFNPSNPDIRYSIADYSTEDWYDLVQIIRPLVGQELVLDPEAYLEFYQKKNLPVFDIDTARRFALEARDHNRRAYRAADEKRRDRFIYETFPYYAAAVDLAKTTKFKIRPSFKYAESEFTGTLIDQSKKGSEHTLSSEQLAQFIVERSGGNPSITEDKIIDFFQHLKYTQSVKDKRLGKLGLYDEYNRFKQESRLGDSALDNAADILFDSASRKANSNGQEFHPGNEKKTEKDSKKSKREQKAIDKLREEYAQKLKSLKEELDSEFADAVRVQRHAADYADMILPKENRGEFIRKIINLLKFSTFQTEVNPDGKRNAELKTLMKKMADRALQIRRDEAVSDIHDLLESAKIKRNWKGIPTSILPSEQATVDRIREIFKMNGPTLTNLLERNMETIQTLVEEKGEAIQESPAIDALIKDNYLVQTYGNLQARPSEVAVAALDELGKLVSGGKSKYREHLEKRKSDVEHHQFRALGEITHGAYAVVYGEDAKNHWNTTLKNESLGTLLRTASGSEIQNFDQSLAGEFYIDVEDATQSEQTKLNKLQTDFDTMLASDMQITYSDNSSAQYRKELAKAGLSEDDIKPFRTQLLEEAKSKQRERIAAELVSVEPEIRRNVEKLVDSKPEYRMLDELKKKKLDRIITETLISPELFRQLNERAWIAEGETVGLSLDELLEKYAYPGAESTAETLLQTTDKFSILKILSVYR